MDRTEGIIKQVVKNNVLLELPTGFGKTRNAIELIKKRVNIGGNVLIVIPRLVLISNWEAELKKWGCFYDYKIHYSTYVSLHKYTGEYDMIICDEAHHLSERSREFLESYKSKFFTFLSATVNLDIKYYLKDKYNVQIIKVSLSTAIKEDILPDPKIVLVPLELTKHISMEFIINPKGTKEMRCSYAERWIYSKNKNNRVRISCSTADYYDYLSGMVEFYKKKAMGGNALMKNRWLQKAGERLKFLANLKTNEVIKILEELKGERVLTFCADIQQATRLSCNCITSKNKNSDFILDKFNKGIINHITACNILNEGCNLTDCKYGVFASINSSEVMVTQKIGRILRHKNPVIIIPYYIHTREEELVDKILETVSDDNVIVLKDFKKDGIQD